MRGRLRSRRTPHSDPLPAVRSAWGRARRGRPFRRGRGSARALRPLLSMKRHLPARRRSESRMYIARRRQRQPYGVSLGYRGDAAPSALYSLVVATAAARAGRARWPPRVSRLCSPDKRPRSRGDEGRAWQARSRDGGQPGSRTVSPQGGGGLPVVGAAGLRRSDGPLTRMLCQLETWRRRTRADATGPLYSEVVCATSTLEPSRAVGAEGAGEKAEPRLVTFERQPERRLFHSRKFCSLGLDPPIR